MAKEKTKVYIYTRVSTAMQIDGVFEDIEAIGRIRRFLTNRKD